MTRLPAAIPSDPSPSQSSHRQSRGRATARRGPRTTWIHFLETLSTEYPAKPGGSTVELASVSLADATYSDRGLEFLQYFRFSGTRYTAMGMRCEVTTMTPEQAEEFAASGMDPDSLPGSCPTVSLEKAWHGLHFLLTGEVWEGQGPLAFLLAGGDLLDEEDDAIRWIAPDATTEIQASLQSLSREELWSRFDAEKMAELEIYPGIWDEPEEDLQEEYLMYYDELQKLLGLASSAKQGLVVSIE